MLAASTWFATACDARVEPESKAVEAWARSSQYIEMRDGTLLAADIFRPAHTAGAADPPFPVVWLQERYHRARRVNGAVLTKLHGDRALRGLVASGYVVVVVDGRGTGASFGVADAGPFSELERRDAYDVTEWLARQPWSNGNVGMIGSSYSGAAQYMAASECPPHLKAIMPEMALFDLYGFLYAGGIFRDGFARTWSDQVERLDSSLAVAPVDGADGGRLLAAAVGGHARNRDHFEMFRALPHRDSVDVESGNLPYTRQSPSGYTTEISRCNVAIYQLAGWRDIFIRDALLAHNALSNPRRLVIGAWSHTERDGIDLEREYTRWFDHWLKGIDTGVMDEAPVRYRVMGAKGASAWRVATTWPPQPQRVARFYLGAGNSGTTSSINDGVLTSRAPESANARDSHALPTSATSGKATRWANGHGGPFAYGNMQDIESKGLTYTSPPLESDLIVTGSPIVHLWLKTAREEQPIFAFLSEVDQSGHVKYVTEGQLRVSHRRRTKSPYGKWDVPHHSGLKRDLERAGAGAVELVFDLLPTSNLFDRGHRVRFSITGADRDNAESDPVRAPTAVTIERNTLHQSFVNLPIDPEPGSNRFSSLLNQWLSEFGDDG